MLVILISIMMNLNNYAKNPGIRNIFIFVLIDPKRDIKEDTEFVMKAKTHIECTPEMKPF